MKKAINRLQQLLDSGNKYLSQAYKSELVNKPNPEKWSKKEILGHLIDSGINNLQRFTEIQFEDKPFKIRKYNQDQLVVVNDYQNSELNEITAIWLAINNRIIEVIKRQTDETLSFAIEFDDGTISDLRFLINDYVDHLEHHLNQITKI